MADRARLVDENDRTDEQKAAIQKVDDRWAYDLSRRGNSTVPPMIPPPATWRPELVGEKRTERWRYAAELNGDGGAKNAQAHVHARMKILWDARVDEAKGKNSCDRTQEDDDVIEAEKVRKAERKEHRKARHVKEQRKKQDVCNAFLEKHPELLVANGKPLTEEEAFDIAFDLFDEKESELFDKLGSKTLRQALYDANPSTSIYIGSGRWFGKESYRFMVDNAVNATTTLTRMDGTSFKAKDQDYKDLELISVPVGIFTSWSDCTSVEAALQLILDDLEVGSQRLWLQSGVGRDRRQLRGCDTKHIEKLKAKGEAGNLTFVCFITILRNVEVLSRRVDAITGTNVVESIKAGAGTICRVHQPKRRKPIDSHPGQKVALDATRLKLGFNSIEHNHKRKLDDFLSESDEESEERNSIESEDEESSDGSEDDETVMGCA